MSSQKTHYNTSFSSHNHSIILCCNGISSPANMGSIFRLADAFGIEKILFDIEHVDITSARLRRTARATEKNISFESNVDLEHVLHELSAKDYKIAAIEITDKSIPIHKATFKKPNIVLVLGNEAFGVSKSILDLCDSHWHIDMFGLNSSMNVAQATGIALYEITKQLNAL